MDSTLDCCAGGLGSIPADVKSKKVCQKSDVFFYFLAHNLVGYKMKPDTIICMIKYLYQVEKKLILPRHLWANIV